MNILVSILSGNKTDEYLGRHQEALLIKEILGESVAKMVMQVAINNDIAERNIVLEQLEGIERHINSEQFDTVIDIEMTNKKIMELIFDGYKSCVLQNDVDLERRCFHIYDDTVEYAKNYYKNKGQLSEEKDKAIDGIRAGMLTVGCLIWATLGDSFGSFDEQYAWMIISSLVFQGAHNCVFNKGDFVGMFVGWATILDPKNLDKSKEHLAAVVEGFKRMKRMLIEIKVINNTQGEIIDNQIQSALSESQIA